MYLVGLHIYYKLIHGPYNVKFTITFTVVPLIFHIVSATIKTLFSYRRASFLIPCFLRYNPLCHSSFHLAIIFKSGAAIILFHSWKQMKVTRRQLDDKFPSNNHNHCSFFRKVTLYTI